MSAGQAQQAANRIRDAAAKDFSHPLMNKGHPDYAATQEEFLRLNRIASGDPEGRDVRLEVVETGQSRAPAARLPYVDNPSLGLRADEPVQDALSGLGEIFGRPDTIEGGLYLAKQLFGQPPPRPDEARETLRQRWGSNYAAKHETVERVVSYLDRALDHAVTAGLDRAVADRLWQNMQRGLAYPDFYDYLVRVGNELHDTAPAALTEILLELASEREERR
jgi:hypothetical protein